VEQKNDIVSRQCRSCQGELLDPNRKLKDKASNQQRFIFDVHETEYLLSISNGHPLFIIKYSVLGDTGYLSKKKNL